MRIAPSAGITPQVRRVSAGVPGRYLSRPPPAPLFVLPAVHATAMADRELPVLRGERVLLRPLAQDDAAALAAILAEPAVARWWGNWDAESVRVDLLEYDGDAALALEAGGELAGLVLVTEEEEPD